MSPRCPALCLLVLLGGVLVCGSPIPNELVQHLQSIEDVLNLTHTDIVRNPIFSSVISSINTSCQRKEIQILNATLEVYMRIFSSILQQDQHHLASNQRKKVQHVVEQLQKTMEKLQKKMEDLKRSLHHDREDVISRLNKIQVSDPINQRKALAELKEVYQVTSVFVCHHGPSAQ